VYENNRPSTKGAGSPSATVNADLSTKRALTFGFEWGSDQNEIDPNPFDAATVTVLAFPEKEGDAFTVRFQLHFTDDRALDETFSSPLSTSHFVCGGAPRARRPQCGRGRGHLTVRAAHRPAPPG